MRMRHRILVVEDDADIRSCLEELLAGEGYLVTAAPSGEDGLEALRAGAFDLVVSDYSLPGRTGTVMLREAAEDGSLGDTPAILVTAHPEPAVDDGVLLLRKPVDPAEFLQVVARFVAPENSLRHLSRPA